jgi:hypothetical protein
MLTEDLVDVPIEVFGGYCPAIVPANLPPGAANVCQDMQFPEAGARTRGGLQKYAFVGPGGVAAITGWKVSAGHPPFSGPSVTFTAANSFILGEIVTIAGLTAGAARFNGLTAPVIAATPTTFSLGTTGAAVPFTPDNGTATPGAAQIPANASINGLKTYLTPSGQQRLLIWDSLGNFFKESPQGSLNLVNARGYKNLLYESQTFFGREYQAFSTAAGGFDIPRQYDDTNWDRVSQGGPGDSPTVADLSWAITAIVRDAIHNHIEIDVAVPIASVIAAGVTVGARVTIAGVQGDVTLNGSYPVAGLADLGAGGTQITVWGAAGGFVISSITRKAGVVTATLASTPPTLPAATGILVTDVLDPSFNGSFPTSGIVVGNQVTWNQGGTNALSVGGTIWIEQFQGPIWAVSPIGVGQTGATTPLPAVYMFGNLLTEFVAGNNIQVAGNTVPGWNGTFSISTSTPPIYQAPTDPVFQLIGTPAEAKEKGLTVVYFNPPVGPPTTPGFGGTATSALPASAPAASGVIGPAGNIDVGLHQVSLAFVTRQGLITQAAPPVTWNAQGGLQATLSDIATGPPNITQRLLLFTPVITPPARTGTFHSLPTGSTALSTPSIMLIPDNITTTWTVDFSDAILISGFAAEYLFSEIELGECAFVLGYNARTCWLGERARIQNVVNFGFDGGFKSTVLGQLPRGWSGTGQLINSALNLGFQADWGDALGLIGDGATPVVGPVTQSLYKDYLGVAILQPNTSYSVRVRVASHNIAQGKLHVNLQSTSQAFTTAGLTVNAPIDLTGNFPYVEFTAALTDVPLGAIPADLVLQVYVDGTPSNGGLYLIDSIEVFPTNTPYNSSVARLPYAFNPEGFDGVTGQVQVRPGDGQNLRAGFPLRNSLYLAKDHYLGYVTDDGVNEPASWQFTEVSATIGICGSNAVDWHEEWAVFAERSGLYICWGSDPVKLTPEIQTDASYSGRTSWASINWAAAATIWVRIDRVNKMILVGAPINGSAVPNIVFMMDYRWLDSAEDIASNPLVAYSGFTGKMLAHGRGRRWALWTISAGSMCFAERVDGTSQPLFGNDGGNGFLWQQVDCALQPTDTLPTGSIQIPWSYQTYASPSPQEEQLFQLRSHRKLLGYLKWRTWGVGSLNIAVTTAQRSTLLRSYALQLVPVADAERMVNLHGERFYVNLSHSGTGANWIQIERIVLCMKKDSAFMARGLGN